MPDHLEILNPKRSSKIPTGREGWFPYYAGFSSDFATALIRSASLPKAAWVLDPWNGGGTTTSAAAVLGRSSIGIDLNPVMVVAAKARVLCPREKGSLLPLLLRLLPRPLRKGYGAPSERLTISNVHRYSCYSFRPYNAFLTRSSQLLTL